MRKGLVDEFLSYFIVTKKTILREGLEKKREGTKWVVVLECCS